MHGMQAGEDGQGCGTMAKWKACLRQLVAKIRNKICLFHKNLLLKIPQITQKFKKVQPWVMFIPSLITFFYTIIQFQLIVDVQLSVTGLLFLIQDGLAQGDNNRKKTVFFEVASKETKFFFTSA